MFLAVPTEEAANKVLRGAVKADGSLSNGGMYLHWDVGSPEATLDGEFSAEELEMIAAWMRGKTAQKAMS